MKKIKILTYFQSALLIVLGILAIVCPTGIQNAIPVVMGVILLLTGLGKLMSFFLSARVLKSEADLVLGAITLFLGILFLARQEQALNIIAVLWGLVGITTSTSKLYAASVQRRMGQPFLFDVIAALVGLALALVLLFSVDASLKFHIIFAGVYILFWGLVLLVGTFLASRSIKAVREEQLGEDSNIIDVELSDDQKK